jgi:hypothetical protein
MPCGLRGALLALGNDIVVGIHGEVRVGEMPGRGAGMPCGRHRALPLGNDMAVVGCGQDLGGCDRSYMRRFDVRWV